METKRYIETLKKNCRETEAVSMRQALCYYLYNENIPCAMIAKLLNKTRYNTYLSIYKTRDLLSVGDKVMQRAYEEIGNHKIQILPYTLDGKILSKHMGYRMLIDNVIY